MQQKPTTWTNAIRQLILHTKQGQSNKVRDFKEVCVVQDDKEIKFLQ